MRACLFPALCSLLVTTGCVSPTGRFQSRASEDDALSQQDYAFVEALAHFGQGLLYEFERGSVSEQALSHYEAALVRDPDNHALRTRIAVCALHRKDAARAIAVLAESVRRAPRDFRRRVDFAAAFHATGDVDNALTHYRKALKLDPSKTAVYLAAAGMLFSRLRDDEALSMLSGGYARGDTPSLALVYCYEQARRFIERGAVARAIPCLERLAGWDTDRRGRFLHLLGELHAAIGDEAEAMRHFQAAIDAGDAPPATYIGLALAAGPTDPARRRRVLDQATALFPDDATLHFTMGCVLSDDEDYAAAIAAFERARLTVERSGPASTVELDESFYLQYGAACERAGEFKKAEAIFEECIANHPRGHRALNYLAYMWAERGERLDRALVYIDRALAEAPDNGAYVDTRGWIYFRQGDYEKALAEIRRAHTLMGDDAEILDHLGDVFHALNNLKDAADYWSRSFAADPGNASVADKLRRIGGDGAVPPEDK